MDEPFASCRPFGNVAETMIWAFIQFQGSHDAPNPRKIGASAKKTWAIWVRIMHLRPRKTGASVKDLEKLGTYDIPR